ncbi:hypothetical protein B296_00049862 [Ensete ventricosum]|uniref:Uncharacterized protein n=1 Tax=Ensete ventricosum TaxID=4639 RepID=A0A426Y254_ENSVE|nr:hypothetical protein B296_00049862 [Ensete ventricosum]
MPRVAFCRSTILNGIARIERYISVRRSLVTKRYHRLGLFPPCYDPKQVGNSRFRSSSPVEGWYQPDYGLAAAREKEEEGEEKVEPGDPAPLSLDDLEPSLPSLAGRCRRGEGASRPFAGRIFDDCGEKKMTFLLPAQASRRGFAEDFFS